MSDHYFFDNDFCSASELIARLQAILAEHGDLRVCVKDADTGCNALIAPQDARNALWAASLVGQEMDARDSLRSRIEQDSDGESNQA